jgi:RecA-family ATPase
MSSTPKILRETEKLNLEIVARALGIGAPDIGIPELRVVKSARLDPDREQLATFIRVLFKHASPDNWVSLRAFPDDCDGPPFKITPVRLKGDLNLLVDKAYRDAKFAAADCNKVVFCPPIATFNNSRHAREEDLEEGLVLSVECDKRVRQARAKLEKLLGPATVVVASGGEWTDPETGEVEPKLHLHHRLKIPARGKDEQAKLKLVRKLAAQIVGGDPSNVPMVHPIRWPGSWHRKGEPRLCRIVDVDPEREIELDAALDVLQKAAGDDSGAVDSFEALGEEQDPTSNWGEFIGKVLSGESYHDPLNRLAAKVIKAGMDDRAASNMLRGLMRASAGRHDARWWARYNDIDRCVSSALQFREPIVGGKPQPAPKAYFLEELQKLPVELRQWIVEDFILANELNGIFGDGGTGKDYLLFELAIAMTCGAQWLGRDVKQGRVMYFPSEDAVGELRRREDRISAYYNSQGTYNPIAKQLMIMPMVGHEKILATYNHNAGRVLPTPWFTTTCEMIDEFKPDLVIVGNRVNIFSVNQNDDAQACQCMGLLTNICLTYNTSIIMPSHVSLRGGKAEGTSGSVQWNNACRLRTFLRRPKDDEEKNEDGPEPDPNMRELEVMKANYSMTGITISLQWHEGLFKPDVIEIKHKEPQSEADTNAEDEDEVLRLLDDLVPGDHVSPNRNAPNSVVARFSKLGSFKRRDRKGRARIDGAVKRLYAKRVLETENTGSPSRPRFRIVRV